ncbi:MAG: phosphoglucosamine mutase [candidate division KSB1 bacterium]|nr:phosphoglucosamine mutase [candidate division KSB1 bacterium]
MKNLMISVSGVRGIVGEGLTPEVALRFSQAYASEFGPGKIVVARDSRVTGPMLMHAVWSGLMAVGCDVVDIGLATTPTAELVVERPDMAGGLILTASHNPRQWNALKMLGSDGMFISAEKGEKIVQRIQDNSYDFADWDKMGHLIPFNTAAQDHISSILDLSLVDTKKIKEKKFKLVVDCCNGAGGVILPEFLHTLGCDVVFLNREPNGWFPREPEPVPANLGDLCQAVKKHQADLGCAVDPDVDRLALVSEEGVPLGEEYTLALVSAFVMSRQKGDVVVNASTTRAIDDVVKEYGGRVHRTPVGEYHVATKAKQIGAVLAGEGNGGVMLPELHLGRDALVGIALILQYLADQNKPVSELSQAIPQYAMVKDKLTLDFEVDAKAIVSLFDKAHSKDEKTTIDGVKLLFRDSWVHVRASNTEPIIRVIAEAPSEDQARDIVNDMKKEMQMLSKQ